jgi:phosphohistidine phosphatase
VVNVRRGVRSTAMTVLCVVRHAIAEPRDPERWPDDALRPLTAKGEASFRAAAGGLRRIAPSADVVLSSPYARAWRTAEILHEEAGWPPPTRCDALAAVRAPGEAVPIIRAHENGSTIGLVGHEPHLSALVGLLTGAAGIQLKKGGAVCIRRAGDEAEIRWLVTPKILRSLAG